MMADGSGRTPTTWSRTTGFRQVAMIAPPGSRLHARRLGPERQYPPVKLMVN